MQTIIQLQDVFTDEPDQVAEVRGCGSVADELEHAGVLHAIHVQRNGPDRDAYHRFRMIEELDGLCVQGEIVGVFVVEEVDRVGVQLQAECLQEQDVVAHHVLVREVELVDNYGVYVVVAEQVV